MFRERCQLWRRIRGLDQAAGLFDGGSSVLLHHRKVAESEETKLRFLLFNFDRIIVKSVMNVSLPKELEDFISHEVSAGSFPDASAVVIEALREFREKADFGACPSELKTALLAAVNGPHHPLPPDYFDKIREQLAKAR